MQKSDEDLRVRRTRKLLQEAFIQLTIEKGNADITVSDIAERAMVNRSTFYRHYLDKCDLMERYMDELYYVENAQDRILVSLGKGLPKEEVPHRLLVLLQRVRAYSEFYRIMLGAKGDAGFTEDFRQHLEERFRYVIQKHNLPEKGDRNAIPLEMRIKYVSSAGVGAIVWWLENNQPCSAEQLASWISKMSFSLWSKPSFDDNWGDSNGGVNF